MIYATDKHRKTRKVHTCVMCKAEIPIGTVCLWYKVAIYGEDDVKDTQYESYMCPKCENEKYEEPQDDES